jgi:hypothetical protein
MATINYGRLIASIILASVFYFVADGVIHGKFLGADHKAAITGAGKQVKEDPTAFAYFAAFDLGKALVVMLLYVAGRARFGPGPTTAIWAGIVGWLAIEVLPNIANMPFPFYPKSVYWKWIALEFVPMVLGALLGGWVYKESVTPM